MAEFLLIYNPLVQLPASQRFPAMVVVPALALAYTHRHRTVALGGLVPKRFVLLIGFLLIVSVRTNPVFDETGASVVVDNTIQTWLTIYVIVASFYFYRVVGRKAFLRSIRWYATGIALYLAAVTRLDVGWLQTSRAGDFTDGTYQQLGDVFAIATILQVTRIRELNSMARLSTGTLVTKLAMIGAFLFMVMQNEARGETIGLVVALTVIGIPRLSVIVGVAIIFFPIQIASLFASLGFQGAIRLVNAAALDDLGLRDELLGQSWALLDDAYTLAFGRGANYFQFFYGFPFGFYPHNIFVEAAITGGIVGFLIVCWAYLYPLLRGYLAHIAGRRVDVAALSIAVYVTLVAAKSGALSPGWGIGLFAPLFSALIATSGRTVTVGRQARPNTDGVGITRRSPPEPAVPRWRAVRDSGSQARTQRERS